jgi:DNA-binding MarR family transcriptional regulator
MDKLLLKNQLCFPLYLCSKEIIRKYTPFLNKLDLTYTQYIVMMYLWENKECNVKELGKTLILDSNTLTPLLKKLESKNYITRTKSSNDSRNTIIKITESGLKLKENALYIQYNITKCVNLSEEEAQTLYKILYKVLYNIEKEDN